MWSKATLKFEDQTLKLLRDREAWKFEQIVGTDLIRFDETHMEAVDRKSGKTRWKSAIIPVTELTILTHGAGILFFVAESDDSNKTELTVRRLKLNDGTWLENLVIPLSEDEQAVMNEVVAAHRVEDGVIILSKSKKYGEIDDIPVTYRLSKFNDGLAWSKVFPSEGTLIHRDDASFLLALWDAKPGIRPFFSEAGNRLIVCAGPLEDLICLDPRTGNVEWKIPRIWEYREGFTGPSFGQYYLGRYGIEDIDVESVELNQRTGKTKTREWDYSEDYFNELKQNVKEARERIEKQYCWIVAGPVVIPDENDPERGCMYVATALSESKDWTGILSDCVIYAIGFTTGEYAEGYVYGRETLPRFLQADKFHPFGQSLLWLGEENTIARLYPFREYDEIDLDWRRIRGKPGAERKSWLRQSRTTSPSDFHGRHLLMVREGGFVEEQQDRLFHYPLSLIDLETLQERELMLNLPLTGQVQPPTNNYSHSKDGWVTNETFLMTIYDVEFDGDDVLITFVYRGNQHVLEFDLSSVLLPACPCRRTGDLGVRGLVTAFVFNPVRHNGSPG